MATITTTAEFRAPNAATPLRWGTLFRAGDYKAKNYSMTADELKAAVEAFEPVPIDLEHMPTMLSGKLGMLQEVKLSEDGTTLLGGVAEQPWLSTVLDDLPRKVSCTWDRATKQLKALAYTLDPHIPDAAVFAAFANSTMGRHDTSTGQSTIQKVHDLAAKSGAVCDQANPNGTTTYDNAYYNSGHENAAMQEMHDTAIRHGAKCQDMAGSTSLFAGARHSAPDKAEIQKIHDHSTSLGAECSSAKMHKEKPMTLWEEFKKALGGDGEPAAEFKTTAVTPTVTVTSKQPDPEVERLKAENAKLRQTQQAQDAATFAESEIAAKRAYPGERAAMIAAFAQAASDDATHGTVTFADGTSSNRVDVLKAAYAARAPHTLTEEVIKTTEVVELSNPQSKSDKDKQADAASYLALMNATSLGQQILQAKKES